MEKQPEKSLVTNKQFTWLYLYTNFCYRLFLIIFSLSMVKEERACTHFLNVCKV